MTNSKRGLGQTALITGASMGIGVDLAECFAAGGYDLVISARSGPPLTALAKRLTEAHGVKVVAITQDLGEQGGGAALAKKIAAKKIAIDVLVNNAGYGHAAPFDQTDAATQLGMIDLNDRALVELTQIYWKGMLERKRGGVLNVASTAAFVPGPFMAVYYASKAFVLSFSEALWEEASGAGVHVSCLCPGPTASEFRARAGTGATRLGHTAAVMASMPVAQMGYDGFQANRRVVVTGAKNAFQSALAPLLPRGMILKTVRRLQSPA